MRRDPLTTGSVIDGFTLGEKLHQGGMAEIYAVTKPGITLPLVMKVPLILDGDDPTMIVGFEQEQMILPRLSGRHVPQCIAIGDFSEAPYLVMERIGGQSLLERFREAPLPISDVVEISARIATALASLHRQHVVHLDLKPSNIMFRPFTLFEDGSTRGGEAVFIDFGLSRHLKLPDLLAEEFRVPIWARLPTLRPNR
jgi:serine/threonine protein kinase